MLEVFAARPVYGVGAVEVEPGGDVDAASEVIAELMGEMGVQTCLCALAYVGGAADVEVVHRAGGPERSDGDHAHHYLGIGGLSDPSRALNHGGRIVRAGNHVAGEDRASGVEVR